MGILQGQLYVRTRTVQVKSGMSIDSHPESYVLVQTASPYSPGKYVNWNLSFSMEILYISYREFFKVTYGNSSRSTVRPYKNCTGQVWYVWYVIDSHPESYVLVQTASPYSPGKYVNWNLSFSMEI